jgi:ribose/xylose/arabinose/galactoside ABC-type transport system permease subunit
MTANATQVAAGSGAGAPAASKLRWVSWLVRLGPLLGLLFVLGLFSALSPRTFVRADNVQLMLEQTAVVGTAALGMTLIIISGGIDLSVGANIALGTVVIAQLLVRGWPALPAALAGIAACTLVGLFIAILVTQLRLSSFIVTLGLWGGLRGFAKWLANESTINTPHTWLNGLLELLGPNQQWMIVPPGVWVLAVLTVITAAVLRYTRFGRHVFAIGSNEQTARLCGVHVNRTKALVFIAGTALAGVAGVLQYSFLTLGDPTTAYGYELNIIAAVVIGGASLTGGQGSALGTIIGALMMTAVANGCGKMGWPNPAQDMVTGGIIILASVLDQLRHWRRT